MKNLIVCGLLAAGCCFSAASQSKLSGSAQIMLMRHNSEKAVSRAADTTEVMAFITLNQGYTSETLRAKGIEIQSDFGDICIVTLPLSRAEEIASMKEVKAVEFGEQSGIMMDRARTLSGVDEVHAGTTYNNTAYTGKGVITGLYDTGLDPNHAAFRNTDGTSRVKAIFQAKGYGTATVDSYLTADEISHYETDTRYETHGTHVAGIMAGSKGVVGDYAKTTNSGTVKENGEIPYYGVAYESDLVIGCGGYASFAVVKAAQELGIPTVLLEVNALPGKVTQMLAKKADRVLVCFEQAKKLLGGDEKIILTGAPVRGEILAASREKARAKFGLGENDQLVVSFWGSMGAKYMNEHMAGTLALECKNGVSYHHVHATGAAARDWLPKMAREQGADFENHPNIQYTEYIYDMADRMAAADLIVCRAGAATLGELCMLGRPALLVPSPFVAENHQEKNARALESAGGCRVLLEKDATPQKLYDEIGDMLSDPLRLHAMGENATVLAAHDASDKIYREILRAIENHGK